MRTERISPSAAALTASRPRNARSVGMMILARSWTRAQFGQSRDRLARIGARAERINDLSCRNPPSMVSAQFADHGGGGALRRRCRNGRARFLHRDDGGSRSPVRLEPALPPCRVPPDGDTSESSDPSITCPESAPARPQRPDRPRGRRFPAIRSFHNSFRNVPDMDPELTVCQARDACAEQVLLQRNTDWNLDIQNIFTKISCLIAR